jgi:hypothetical protein
MFGFFEVAGSAGVVEHDPDRGKTAREHALSRRIMCIHDCERVGRWREVAGSLNRTCRASNPFEGSPDRLGTNLRRHYDTHTRASECLLHCVDMAGCRSVSVESQTSVAT